VGTGFKNIFGVSVPHKTDIFTEFLWFPERVGGKWHWGKTYYYLEHFFQGYIKTYMTKEEAFMEVMKGNLTFASDECVHPDDRTA
jgi:hypothetical protein